ncbi:16S rRNA (guanine(966)-N(2))-methyltransferase RsmD [Nocardioides zhouii]|uniref:16S rRNA (Guanine(966)-N(2))-methyltransferase RsmD n=1 Tax=Nocardioides zhouii TaxID=1168729 RepID=A0A4Q2T4J0_9ACTN|nr:16S rRNA (guanine(966)-N(2))-methyltransferase RsmD [Nocardioides zhouii]RYC12893.1 16S rRNA (guanine(966)-N(2))-methyltransferase RsmD [Nocardioides zhouii]
MTRIIGGTAGGRRLETPRGQSTRPTSDRVREALFSAIEARTGSLDGLRFLDLYAGSGAVGLEARSRGAGVVTMVEQDRRTAALITRNAGALGFSRARVVAAPVSTVLQSPPAAPYDLVFSDPPYPTPDEDVDGDLLALVAQGWLVPGALVVVERAAKRSRVTWPEGIVEDRTKRYGETMLWYGHATPAASPES